MTTRANLLASKKKQVEFFKNSCRDDCSLWLFQSYLQYDVLLQEKDPFELDPLPSFTFELLSSSRSESSIYTLLDPLGVRPTQLFSSKENISAAAAATTAAKSKLISLELRPDSSSLPDNDSGGGDDDVSGRTQSIGSSEECVVNDSDGREKEGQQQHGEMYCIVTSSVSNGIRERGVLCV